MIFNAQLVVVTVVAGNDEKQAKSGDTDSEKANKKVFIQVCDAAPLKDVKVLQDEVQTQQGHHQNVGQSTEKENETAAGWIKWPETLN